MAKKEKTTATTTTTTTTATPTPTATTTATDKSSTDAVKEEKKRYILFVGNLSFKTTEEDLRKHFSSAGEVASVRMITDKITKKSKGFAFMEFTDVQCFTKALAFHHTTLKKRTINVEMTSGGGGNSENRRKKINDKNDQLQEKRKKIHEKRLLAGKVNATDQQQSSGKKGGAPAATTELSRSDMEMAQKMQEIAQNGRYIVSGPNSIAVKKRQ